MVNNIHRNQGQLKACTYFGRISDFYDIINIMCLLIEQGFRLKHLAVKLGLQHLSPVPQVY